MAVEPDAVRRGSVVLVRVRADKARPAVVFRSDLLAELPYATVLPITSELRADASMRVDIEASPETGLRVASQVMVDWPQTIRLTEMGQVVGRVDMEAMRAVTAPVGHRAGHRRHGQTSPPHLIVRHPAGKPASHRRLEFLCHPKRHLLAGGDLYRSTRGRVAAHPRAVFDFKDGRP